MEVFRMFRYPHRGEYYSSYATQSYGRIITVITPLLTLVSVMCIISSQLLYLSAAQAENTHQLVAVPGTLSPLLKSSRFISHADARQTISLSFGLRPRDNMAFQQALSATIHAPEHQARPVLDTNEVTRHFSPTQASYTALVRWLQAAGFRIIHTYTHRLLLDFSGTMGQVQRVFQQQINNYRAPDGTLYYANSGAPLLPPAIASQVMSINGLNNATRWMHTALRQGSQSPANNQLCATSSAKTTPGASNNARAAVAGLSDLYRAHYTGSGQTLALFELAQPAMSDLSSYMACTRHKGTRLQRIDTPLSAAVPQPTSYEATVDAEAILDAVPQLQSLKVYATANNEKSYLDQWGQIIQDDPAVVSTSWGLCEQQVPAQLIRQEALFFQLAALQGQSVIAASTINCPAISRTAVAVSDPASQPFVTGVGSTALIFAVPRGSHTSLLTAGRLDPASVEPPAMGGSSQLWAMPGWQHIQAISTQSMNASASGCPHASGERFCREVPDVALNADAQHNFLAYCTQGCTSQHPWLNINGGALATPFWAAFVTLSNQVSQQHGGGRLGFINPLLYQLAANPVSYASSFHDIITDNEHGQPAAGAGYDLISGLGEYRAQPLANRLANWIQPLSR
ncbi:kumamolisin [Dictyobacter sp. S3.2.2.5]|uniref:Kumamolisin n=1 Tax=Dictyobacter halimunensis TaxID=3026934 RepID=A0ABQ6G240_9CHLR|nr:kumamolisin [Dictyobacter sp. S3.2.2.5]